MYDKRGITWEKSERIGIEPSRFVFPQENRYGGQAPSVPEPTEPTTTTKLVNALGFLEEAEALARYIERRLFFETPPAEERETAPYVPESVDGRAAMLSQRLAGLVGQLRTIESRL